MLKCDVKSFFASIDHDILFQIIQKKVQEERASSLIRNVIDSYDPGMPLGNLTSQLFANIYMNAFDHYVQEQFSVFRYMRYSDDFLLVHDDHAYLHACISRIADYLASERHLVLHPHKIVLKRFDQGIDWLGYVLYPGYRLIRSSTKKRMWRHIDKTVSEYVDGTVSLETLKSMLSSYLGLVYVSNENNEKKLLYTLLSSL